MSFLTSFAIIILCALTLGNLFRKIKLPALIGTLLIGILLGPYVFNLISPDILAISADLRKFALIVILTRAGLSLKLDDIKKVGRPAFLLCFLPATFEIIGYVVFAPLLLGLSPLESALAGAVMGAVSPAVVVPRMLKLQREGYGTNKNIPQMITAGASCDDVFVIVLFSALLTTANFGEFNYNIVWQIPTSVVMGIAVGILVGLLFSLLFKRFHTRDTIKVLILLSVSFLLVALENLLENSVPFSALLAVITLGVTFNLKSEQRAERLSAKYEKVWVFAEIVLFALVGAEANIADAVSQGWNAILVLLFALAFRLIGVFVCLIKTPLDFKERLFCAIAYIPKATVQAAIGAIPLAAGLACGQTILTCAVLSILVTAPLGAALTDLTYKKLLTKNERQS